MLLEYSEKQQAYYKKPSNKKVVSSPVKDVASLSLAVVDQAAADTSQPDYNRGRFQVKAVRGFARPAETSTLDQRLDAMRVLLQDRPLVLPPQDADMHSAQSSQQHADFTPASPEVNSACIAGAVSGTDPSERTQISDESAAGEVADCLPGLPHAGAFSLGRGSEVGAQDGCAFLAMAVEGSRGGGREREFRVLIRSRHRPLQNQTIRKPARLTIL